MDDKAIPCNHCAGELQTADELPVTLAPGNYFVCKACGRIFNEDLVLMSVGRFSGTESEEENDERPNTEE
jgi:hypothetical protein